MWRALTYSCIVLLVSFVFYSGSPVARSYSGKMSRIPTSVKWKAPAGEIPDRTHTKHSLPVVVITIDPAELMDPVNGIYTFGLMHTKNNVGLHCNWFDIPFNFTKRGSDWKRRATFSVYSPKGKILYSADCKVSIHGNATRAFPQKSLRISATGGKGNKNFKYDFFMNGTTKHRSVILRNSGNDWGRSLIADAMQIELLENTGLVKPEYSYCVVYINNEYWGIHQLASRTDEEALAVKHNVKKKKITLLEGLTLSYGDYAEWQTFNKLMEMCRAQPKQAFTELSNSIDVDNFLTYIASIMYVANADWPRSNIKCYKVKDEKWKWILHDLDCAFGYAGDEWIEVDMFSRLQQDPTYAGIFYRCCMTDPSTRENFRKKLEKLWEEDFATDKVTALIDKHAGSIKSEIQFHSNRWRMPASFGSWNNQVSLLKDFAVRRNKIFAEQINVHFSK